MIRDVEPTGENCYIDPQLASVYLPGYDYPLTSTRLLTHRGDEPGALVIAQSMMG